VAEKPPLLYHPISQGFVRVRIAFRQGKRLLVGLQLAVVTSASAAVWIK
jgi:hypothetical protein